MNEQTKKKKQTGKATGGRDVATKLGRDISSNAPKVNSLLERPEETPEEDSVRTGLERRDDDPDHSRDLPFDAERSY